MKEGRSRYTGRMALQWLIYLGVLFMMFIRAGADNPAQANDLLGVYRQAVEINPVLKEAKALLNSDQASHELARSALMPRINASADIYRDHTHITGFGKDFGASSPAASAFGDITDTYTGGSYSVSLSQPLVDGQAWAGLRSASARVRAGEAAVKAAEQDLIRQITEAYFGVLKARADERVALGQKALLQEILDQARANLNVGSGDIISLKEAQASFDTAESRFITSRNAVEIAVQQLRRLTQQDPGPLDDVGPITALGPVPDQVEPWILTAETNQPLLEQAREEQKAAADQVDIARRARWPELSLSAGYGYNKGNFMPSVETQNRRIGLVCNLPFYEGGRISAQIAQARAREAASHYRMEDLKDRIALNTRNAFLTLKNSVSGFNAAGQALDSAKTSLEATRKGYEIGARSIIDLLTSAQAYENIQRDYYQALYDHVLARVRLKWATGVINEADITAINELLCAPAE